jgi:hypothetical protein
MFLFKVNRKLLSVLSTLIILSLLSSCNSKRQPRIIEPSFYYWKSVLNISSFEKQKLDSLQVKTIYIKFFDVAWDETTRKPVPAAKLLVADKEDLKGFSVIPTVFITNECIQKIDTSQTKELGEKIMELLKKMIAEADLDSIPEVQIDCDWTESTRDKYFEILKAIKSLKANAKLSATIRLHQIKFVTGTGVPPVDLGLLMCYNMGNLKNPDTKNSILETEELKKYIGNLSRYPLPLDVAFPLFNWKVLYRNNQYAGLIQNLPNSVFTSSFCTQAGNRYQVLKDTFLQGYDLRKGDMLRDEQSDIKEVRSAANEISKQLKNTALRVSLYHLDSVILSKYSTHEMESIYNSLH